MRTKDSQNAAVERMSFWSDTTDLVYLGCLSEIPRQLMGKSKQDLPADFYEKRVYPGYTLTHDATLPIQRVEVLVPGEDKVLILWRVPYRRTMKVE